jgi:hypothetical protein
VGVGMIVVFVGLGNATFAVHNKKKQEKKRQETKKQETKKNCRKIRAETKQNKTRGI